MTYSASVAIPHVNSYPLLELCLACLFKHQNPLVDMHVIIVDQSNQEARQKVCALAEQHNANGMNIQVLQAPAIDAGYPLDVALKVATGTYFCSLDCDCFVINKNWLYLPIWLISHGFTRWVGFNTVLEWSYKYKGPFFHLNNYYRVCDTDLARYISDVVGFMRPSSRYKVNFTPRDTSWERTPGATDCDNGVVAQWYADQKHLGPKLALSRNGCIGTTPKWGVYGDNLEDLAIHLCFAQTMSKCKNAEQTLGPEYLKFRQRIEAGMTPDDVIALHQTIKHGTSARRLDGVPASKELNNIIEETKAQ